LTTLIIARHGNTFGPDDTPTRVGARTDLPLVDKGKQQARALGQYLAENDLTPDTVYASELQRTQQTASIAIKEVGGNTPVHTLDIFNEIDYGPDENKTEDDVIARIGEHAIKDWDEHATVPDGWKVDPEQIIKDWIEFGEKICADGAKETVLVVTSNGIARFAPHMTGDFEAFAANHTIKLSTGALAVLQHENGRWIIKDWNIKP